MRACWTMHQAQSVIRQKCQKSGMSSMASTSTAFHLIFGRHANYKGNNSDGDASFIDEEITFQLMCFRLAFQTSYHFWYLLVCLSMLIVQWDGDDILMNYLLLFRSFFHFTRLNGNDFEITLMVKLKYNPCNADASVLFYSLHWNSHVQWHGRRQIDYGNIF